MGSPYRPWQPAGYSSFVFLLFYCEEKESRLSYDPHGPMIGKRAINFKEKRKENV